MVIPDIFTILKLMLRSALRCGGVLTVAASLLLLGCGDPEWAAKQEKSPEEIKVIKAVDK